MIAPITDNLNAIGTLCRRYGVRKLEVFGSAATGTFDPETSDIDMIAEFSDFTPGFAKRNLAFVESLESLLGYRVDLIENRSFANPYFRESVDSSRRMIFGSPDRGAISSVAQRCNPPGPRT